MSGMVERVARAICKAQTQGTGFWKAFIPEARAAIAAMREPTEGMWMYLGALGTTAYKNAIDAALEEKP